MSNICKQFSTLLHYMAEFHNALISENTFVAGVVALIDFFSLSFFLACLHSMCYVMHTLLRTIYCNQCL